MSLEGPYFWKIGQLREIRSRFFKTQSVCLSQFERIKFNYLYIYIYIWRKDSQIRGRQALHVMVMAKENK